MTRALPAALGALVIAVLAVALVRGADGPQGAQRAAGQDRWQAPDRAFSVAVPPRWRVEHGAAATVVQREDRRGTLVVRRGPALSHSPATLTRGLERRLRRSLGPIEPLRARPLTVRGRTGLLYTFTRPSGGTVQSIAVVPAAGATYTLDAVVGASDPGVARELGTLVRSFAPAA